MTIDTKLASFGRPRSNSKSSGINPWGPHSAKSLKFGFDTTSALSPLSATFKNVSYWKKSAEVPLSPFHAQQKPPLPTRPFQVLPLPTVEPPLHPEGCRKRKRSSPQEEAPLSPIFNGHSFLRPQRDRTPPPAYTEDGFYHPKWDEQKSSLLLSVDQPAREVSARKTSSTLRATLSRLLPIHLSAVLSGIEFEHKVVDRSLSISLYGGPSSYFGHSKCKDEVFDSSIREMTSLCITVGQRVEEYGSHAVNAVWSFIVWFLAWVRATRRMPLEAIHLSIPEAFDGLYPSQPAYTLINRKPIINTHTLSWVGGVGALSYLLQFCSTESLRELQITSELGMDDALILLRDLCRFKIYTLSIGAVVSRPPSLVPSYPVKQSSKFDSQLIPIHNLDCLKVSSTVDLFPLFDALSLPKLCKLELDVADAPIEVFDGIIDLPLDWDQMLYFDIVHDVEVERNDALKDVLQHLSPGAYVATNGDGF